MTHGAARFVRLAAVAAASFAVVARADDAAHKLRVVATTTFVADTVRVVAGDLVDVTALLPRGVDPHAFEPSPRDAAALADADAVFLNGLGLEHFMGPLLETATQGRRPAVRTVSVSDGVPARRAHADGERGETDPHVWLDPLNVILWAGNVERALAELDPPHAAAFTANADAYRDRLRQLDEWVRGQFAGIPPDRRRVVTDHDEFGYFAARYGLDVVGSVVPSFTTLAEPSARELARLERDMKSSGARVILLGQSASPAQADRLAADTGAEVVRLYTGSLGDADGPAGTYVGYMAYNVTALKRALQGGGP